MKPAVLNTAAFRKKLLAWYRKNKRDLPWRRTSDPYRILVSEIMLQQTQVDTVIPYYRRFLKSFPSPTALSRASEQEVLKLWEGLGYYSRARNLHQAAREIQHRFGGKIPGTMEALESLPGIGRYSAGAVASIAFGIPAPIVDGNVKRVLCRLFAIEEDPSKTAVKNQLWELAGTLVPKRAPGDFNQALMEFGATICTPRKPSCGTCPVQKECRARQLGIEGELPRKAAFKAVPKIRMRVAVIKSGRYLLVGRRPDDGLLGGLWAFPEFDWKQVPKEKTLHKKIEKSLGLKTDSGVALEAVVHVYSHRRITYYPRLLTAPRKSPAGSWKWVPMDKIQDYPIPNAIKKILLQVLRRENIPLAAEKPAPYSS